MVAHSSCLTVSVVQPYYLMAAYLFLDIEKHMEATIVEEASFVHKKKKKKKKFVCTKCQSWADANMPGVSVEEIYNEKTRSEEVAGDCRILLMILILTEGKTNLC